MKLHPSLVPPGRLAVVPLAACLVLVSFIFTVSPQALDHSPVAFETRGLWHHVWHYALLAGAILALVGSLSRHPRALTAELAGLILVEAAVALNTTALSTADQAIPGVGIALRVAVMIQVGLRIWILIARPIAVIEVGRTDA